MSVDSHKYEMEGDALVEQEQTPRLFTIEEYAYGLVNFEIPESAVASIFAKRGIDKEMAFADVEKQDRDLIEADIYVWICNGVSKMTATTDSDNGWSHSGGGYTLTEEDKKRLMKAANAIYEQYDEPTVGKTHVTVLNFGIKPANLPLGHKY